MATGLDLAFVRETYQKMPDKELVRVATQDAAGLTPEAQEIVREEIERRGLDKSIVKGVDVQNREITLQELDQYCALARELDCPVCGSSGWWGIPWGPIRTVQSIGQNLKSKRANHSEEPNTYLRRYVLARVGQFESYKDEKEKLQEIISAR